MSNINEDFQLVLADTIAILKNSSINEQFIKMILKRLESFSYTIQKDDSFMISFCIQKVENHIKNSCNTNYIPNGLEYIAIDRVCGEFLFALKQTGKLNEKFNLDVAVKQIQTGDTNITFAIDSYKTPEQRLNELISYLIDKGEGDFICYRKIKW